MTTARELIRSSGVALPRGILLAPPSIVGLTFAAGGYAAALTPSLLPRDLVFLLFLTTVGSLVAYAVGTTAMWALRKVRAIRELVAHLWLRAGVPAVAWIAAIAFTPVAIGWQIEQQTELGMPATLPSTLVIVIGTAVVASVLLMLARVIRVGSNATAALLARIPFVRRWIEARKAGRSRWAVATLRAGVAVGLAVVAFAALTAGFGRIVSSYDAVNADTTGQSDDNLGENSGSAASVVAWDTLGRQGRAFVGNTMKPSEIQSITGDPAQAPTRLYVGMQQADTPEERSALALQELDRVGAWDRPYLAIYSVTGTGWVNPDGINSLETVTGGDVTTVAVQYSAVPSWIGFLLDPVTAQEQCSDTIDAVVDAWRARPADHRPTLILFGESLGSFGGQAAWTADDDAAEVASDIGKIVWIGPPAESTLWKAWQADRTSGPAWQPVIGDDSVARVYVDQQELGSAARNEGPAITFVAHPNDPVVYWSPSMLLQRPDWYDHPLGPGVSSHIRWFPVISYLQLGMDLISGGEPPEVGHNYASAIGPAVALTVAPPGWTSDTTARLQAALPGLRYETG